MEANIIRKFGQLEIRYKFVGKTLTEVTRESQQISFEDIEHCGLCQSTDLAFQMRTVHKKNRQGLLGEEEVLYCYCNGCSAQLDIKYNPTYKRFHWHRWPNGTLKWRAKDSFSTTIKRA